MEIGEQASSPEEAREIVERTEAAIRASGLGNQPITVEWLRSVEARCQQDPWAATLYVAQLTRIARALRVTLITLDEIKAICSDKQNFGLTGSLVVRTIMNEINEARGILSSSKDCTDPLCKKCRRV